MVSSVQGDKDFKRREDVPAMATVETKSLLALIIGTGDMNE